MAGSSNNQDIFDVLKVRRLVELMKEHELSEIDLRQGDQRIQLRRGAQIDAEVVQPQVVNAGQAIPVAPAPAPAAAAETPKAEPESDTTKMINSPMVGTFYSSPDPDSPAYVKVGDHVGPETTVCIVEAMKVFNQIPAEISGKIVSVLLESGESVEYGQPMFKVDAGE